MSLEDIIKKKVKAESFQGIVVRLGNQSELNWWDIKDNKIKSVTINLKIEKAVSFTCRNGVVEIVYV